MNKPEQQNLFHCTECGSVYANSAADKAIDCVACYSKDTMWNRGPITRVIDGIAEHIDQEKNTVKLVRNALDVLEAVYERGDNIAPALYDLRVAVDDL